MQRYRNTISDAVKGLWKRPVALATLAIAILVITYFLSLPRWRREGEAMVTWKGRSAKVDLYRRGGRIYLPACPTLGTFECVVDLNRREVVSLDGTPLILIGPYGLQSEEMTGETVSKHNPMTERDPHLVIGDKVVSFEGYPGEQVVMTLSS